MKEERGRSGVHEGYGAVLTEEMEIGVGQRAGREGRGGGEGRQVVF